MSTNILYAYPNVSFLPCQSVRSIDKYNYAAKHIYKIINLKYELIRTFLSKYCLSVETSFIVLLFFISPLILSVRHNIFNRNGIINVRNGVLQKM